MTLHHSGTNTHLRTHKRACTHTHASAHELLNVLQYHFCLSLSVRAYIVFRHIVSFNIKPQVERAVNTRRYFQQRPRFRWNGFCRTDFVAVDSFSRLSLCNLAWSGDEICNLYTTCLRVVLLTWFHLLQNVNATRDSMHCKMRQWTILLSAKRDALRDF